MAVDTTMKGQRRFPVAGATRDPECGNEDGVPGSSCLTGTGRKLETGSSDIVTPQDLLSEGWIAETDGWQAVNRRILTARRMIALADFSAGDPFRWRTIRARFFFEDLGVCELAKMLGISRRTVARHLQPVHISEDIYDGLVSIPRDFLPGRKSAKDSPE